MPWADVDLSICPRGSDQEKRKAMLIMAAHAASADELRGWLLMLGLVKDPTPRRRVRRR